MYSGSCLCGAISFEINGPVHDIVCCHCSQCRKAQGSAFATNGNVLKEHFRLLSGQDQLSAYAASPEQTKHFCKLCGSPIMSRTQSKPEYIRIRLGTITSDITERPIAHIFTGSKANWEQIQDKLPQYESYEPGRSKTR